MATTFFFNCLHRFAFSRISYSGIIEYVTFSDWFLTLGTICLRFLHVFLLIDYFCFRIIFHCIDVPVCTDHLEGTILDSRLLMVTDRFYSCPMWKEVLTLNHIIYIYIYVIYSSVIQKVIFKKASGFHSSSLYLLILKEIGNLEILILTLKSYRMYYFTFKASNNVMISLK